MFIRRNGLDVPNRHDDLECTESLPKCIQAAGLCCARHQQGDESSTDKTICRGRDNECLRTGRIEVERQPEGED